MSRMSRSKELTPVYLLQKNCTRGEIIGNEAIYGDDRLMVELINGWESICETGADDQRNSWLALNVDGAWLNKAADQINLMCSILTFQKWIHLIFPLN